ncbi:MAG: type III-B CRISPR module RAMP protein Cmr6 [Coriobacteriia bacterium]|nr:type III-B CRISPR module RAMP protein Cmr6 [Coriobacteriia bacterium]
MSVLPLYAGAADSLPAPDSSGFRPRPADAHAGLWFDRFIELEAGARRLGNRADAWIASLGSACGSEYLGVREVTRRLELLGSLGGKWGVFSTTWNFATGLGLPHPLENGFAWHHTLGVPYLSGAAVKGLLRAWTSGWSDELSAEQRQVREREWFGGDADSVSAGSLIFFDALPVAPPVIGADVITPHYGEWYESGGSKPGRPESTPGDWHDPVPVSFLVTKRADFLFAIAPRLGHGTAVDADLALSELEKALDYLGAGAKTAVGYGRMLRDPEKERALTEDPVERAMREVAERDYRLPNHVAWLQELQRDAGRWQERRERAEVARRIRVYMREHGCWRADESEPGSSKDLARTRQVLEILGDDQA